MGLDNGATVTAHAVLIATGARYRKLDVQRLDEFDGMSVYYAATPVEARMCAGDPVVVVGGGPAGVAAATASARAGAAVLLLDEHPLDPELMAMDVPLFFGQRMSSAVRDRGVMHVERELFESSLRSGRTVLELLGAAPHEARQQAMRFRRHNLALFEKLHPHYQDRAKLIAVAKEGRQQFEEQMAREREQRQQRTGRHWDPELRDEHAEEPKEIRA